MKDFKRGLSNDPESTGCNDIIEPCKCNKCGSEFPIWFENEGCAYCSGTVKIK